MDSQDPIQKLRDILATQEKYHEPWTSGVVSLSGIETTLFFKCKDGAARFIELGNMTERDIQTLVDACDPASFGRGPETVLDDTYRKALRLDEGNFSWLFNADSGKFIGQLARGLCPWDNFRKGIRAEPYKLNVYGKGGFFKAHQDTPRAENMFGSLVFVLPFEHQGGNLSLRHRTRGFNFDAPSLLQGAPPLSAAYVAFYSDVEHEVLEVTSGHRVTITFNLYFDRSRAPPILPKLEEKTPENPFSEILRELLRDSAFVRNHEFLGFGLEYDYPRRWTSSEDSERSESGSEYEEYHRHPGYDDYKGGASIWSNLDSFLKGPDAFLFKLLAEAGFKPQLNYLFQSQSESSGFWVMCDHMIKGREVRYADRSTELGYLMNEDEAYIVWTPGQSEATVDKNSDRYWLKSYFEGENLNTYRKWTLPVDWVTKPTANLTATTEFKERGNEPLDVLLSCLYYCGH